ncbi:TetR/AcrR family transcriptional regulator [bacterium]|nr:MAG: TetR/AcrR family transcriptional regulator [bacterium]
MVALKTFQNLPEERQVEILQISLREFALNEYQSASLSNIVQKLGLAKGSFYRYFESKLSLYHYLLNYCIKLRQDFDKNYISNPSTDFFELMLQHLLARFAFSRSHPLNAAFLDAVLRERNSEELGNIQLEIKLKTIEAIRPFAEKGIQQGIFKSGFDTDFIAFSIFKTQFSILEYVEVRFQIDIRNHIKENKAPLTISDEEITRIAQPFLAVFKHGIAV